MLLEGARRLAPEPGATAPALVVIGGSLAVSVALAAALYRFVERPAERVLRTGSLPSIVGLVTRWSRPTNRIRS